MGSDLTIFKKAESLENHKQSTKKIQNLYSQALDLIINRHMKPHVPNFLFFAFIMATWQNLPVVWLDNSGYDRVGNS
jgi:hypothetical protein